MPSSLIFVGLVVLWLLILVPTVARRQQEVARLSPALLSGRVLERPMRHRYPEVLVMERSGPSTVGELVQRSDGVPGPRDRHDGAYDGYDEEIDAEIDDEGHVHGLDDDHLGVEAGSDEHPEPDGGRAADRERDPRAAASVAVGDTGPAEDRFVDGDHDIDRDEMLEPDGTGIGHRDDEHADRSPYRYRPGRGGFDPDAAAAAAHAKYAFRQRVVLALLVLLVAAGATALLVSTVFWWVAGALGAGLVGYLTYLRRQVRIEEAIRARRAARFAAPRRATAEAAVGEDTDPRGADDRGADHRSADHREGGSDARGDQQPESGEDDTDWTADDGEPTRVRGTGQPLGVLPARRRTVDGPASTEHESSLPRLVAAPPPPVPEGTSLVDVDAEEEPDVLDELTPHRRAAGE
ncbi:gephyrin-like molybdotransferase receptor GlpR [Pseudonocardia sp. NPDC049635]|uniref:divisome protein SepX/GlpR n=1 Tax=Pseudonocardia sp. NPDC049635 TaxID=3155506 RepID=UPI0033EFD24E